MGKFTVEQYLAIIKQFYKNNYNHSFMKIIYQTLSTFCVGYFNYFGISQRILEFSSLQYFRISKAWKFNK